GRLNDNQIEINAAGQTLTVDKGVKIRGQHGTINAASDRAVVNRGDIHADGSGGKITVGLMGGGRNEGTIRASGGASLAINGGTGTWTNTGEIGITGGGTLQVGMQSTEAWSSTGTISAENSPVEFSGGFSQAGLGDFRRTGGTVLLTSNAIVSGELRLN